MKKEYTAPKAERMDFNYSNTVVASGTCHSGISYPKTDLGRKPDGSACDTTDLPPVEIWFGDNL